MQLRSFRMLHLERLSRPLGEETAITTIGNADYRAYGVLDDIICL